MEQNYSIGNIDLFGQSHYCSIENEDVNVVWKLLGKMKWSDRQTCLKSTEE